MGVILLVTPIPFSGSKPPDLHHLVAALLRSCKRTVVPSSPPFASALTT